MKELAKFYYGNTPQSDEFIGSSLTLADKDIRAITNAIKSVLPKGSHLETNKSVDPKTGKLEVEVIFPAEYKELVQSAFDFQRSKIEATDSSRKYSTSGAVFAVETKSPADKAKETKAEAKKEKEEKEAEEHRKHTKSALIKVASLITVGVDIARRILASVLDSASKAVTATRQAGDYGVSYGNVRGYSISEKAFGMKEGTNMGAISDIQSKFGNVYAIDEKALEQLAMVMGGGVKDLVTSGMGGDKPELLLNKIVDSYFATAMSGKNSLGQYVGQEKARIELVEQLKKVSPQLAEILSVMLENATNPNSLYYGKFGTYEGMQGLVQTNRMGLTDVDYGVQYTAGQYSNQIYSMLKDIKDGIQTTLAGDIYGVLQKIANSRIFMSAQERIKFDIANKEANEENIEKLQHRINDLGGAHQSDINRFVSTMVFSNSKTAQAKISSGLKGITLADIYKSYVTGKDYNGVDAKYVEMLMSKLSSMHWFQSDWIDYVGSSTLLEQLMDENKKPTGTDKIAVTSSLIKYYGRESLLTYMSWNMLDKKWEELSPEERKMYAEWTDAYFDTYGGTSRTDYFSESGNLKRIEELRKKHSKDKIDEDMLETEVFFENLRKGWKGDQRAIDAFEAGMDKTLNKASEGVAPFAKLDVNIINGNDITTITMGYNPRTGALERLDGDTPIEVDIARASDYYGA